MPKSHAAFGDVVRHVAPRFGDKAEPSQLVISREITAVFSGFCVLEEKLDFAQTRKNPSLVITKRGPRRGDFFSASELSLIHI